MNVLWIISLAFCWVFLGFIAMGVLSAMWVESYTFAHWERVKYAYRVWSVVLGPTLFFVAIGYMIFAVAVTTVRDRMSIWSLPDWILAGFNEPPKKPKESELSDSPTVSP